MSLIVWYPFTKDFKNKGLSDITETVNSGVTLVNSNQFGTCASFDGVSGSKILLDNFPGEEAFGQTTWSVSFWINFKNDGKRGIILGNYKSGGSEKVAAFEINASGGVTNNSLRLYWYTGSVNYNYQSNLIVDANKWTHVCFTYDGTTVKFYKNGELVDSVTKQLTFSGITNNTYIGGDNRSGNILLGELHDFRIYNHTLSTKEIKELSKGLILHYDLKGYGAGENILPLNSLYHSSIEENGYRSQTVFIRDTTATTESYLGWGRTGQVEQSTQYTFSCYLWLDSNVKSVDIFWLSDIETNQKTGTGWVNATRIANVSGLIVNQWNYVTWTFTTPTDDYTGYIRIDNNGSKTEGEHAILKACCPKLEKGSKATPYIPHGLINTDIEDDLSGNGFNGTRQGVTFTPDSPRYYMSTEFDANKDLILDRIFHQGDEVSNLSLSIWAKFKVDLGTSNNLWNLNQNGFWRTRSNTSSQIQSIVYMNSGYQDIRISLTNELALNTWYNIVMTFDNGIFKCYLNGELVGTIDKTSIATTIKCANDTSRWSLGDFTYNQEKFVGKLLDFRIYAKTLTADEVTELYKVSAQVDKTGKLYCGELVEE